MSGHAEQQTYSPSPDAHCCLLGLILGARQRLLRLQSLVSRRARVAAVAAAVAAVHPHVVHEAQHASAVAGVLKIEMGPYLASTVRASDRTNSAHSTDRKRRETVGRVSPRRMR